MRKTLLSLAFLLVAGPAAAQNVSLPSTLDLNGFGKPSIATFGQTFTASAANNLQSFQFLLANDPNYGETGANLRFRGYVMEWNVTNSVATGPVLFQSDIRTGVGGDSYVPVVFSTPGTSLVTGHSYVAFLSASGLAPANGQTTAVEQMAGNDESFAGSWVFADNEDDFGSLSKNSWFVADGLNTAFSATFTSNQSTVPEPSEFVLLGSGLTGLVGFVRVRRKRA